MVLSSFDTLQIFEDLEKAGFDEPPVKAISAVVRRVHDSSDVATKQDIAELRHEIGDLRKGIDTLLANMKFELLRWFFVIFFFQAEDGIRDNLVTGVQTCALPISAARSRGRPRHCADRSADRS